jgi:hypothetical protein
MKNIFFETFSTFCDKMHVLKINKRCSLIEEEEVEKEIFRDGAIKLENQKPRGHED